MNLLNDKTYKKNNHSHIPFYGIYSLLFYHMILLYEHVELNMRVKTVNYVVPVNYTKIVPDCIAVSD